MFHSLSTYSQQTSFRSYLLLGCSVGVSVRFKDRLSISPSLCPSVCQSVFLSLSVSHSRHCVSRHCDQTVGRVGRQAGRRPLRFDSEDRSVEKKTRMWTLQYRDVFPKRFPMKRGIVVVNAAAAAPTVVIVDIPYEQSSLISDEQSSEKASERASSRRRSAVRYLSG